jgi:hypothetical protein
MENLLKQSEEIREKVKKYLIEHLDDLVLCNVDTHYVEYTLKLSDDYEYAVKIWTANGKEHSNFYQDFGGIKLDDYVSYTSEERNTLWEKTENDKKGEGEKRKIEMHKLSNDLYFSFKGVYSEVKFSGYNDNDWWNLYKPEVIKETQEISWKIDFKKMIATYKKV